MPGEQSRIKKFFEARTQKVVNKIEKTPINKFFVFFLVLLSISAVVLGFFQFKKNLEQPLSSSYLDKKRGDLIVEYELNQSATATAEQEENLTLLQNKDSDLDGLSDYSEIYFYKTNAYSEDTDADGLKDKDEIMSGTNPACAEGQECVSTAEAEAAGQVEIPTPATGVEAEEPIDLMSLDFSELQSKLLSGEVTLADLGIDDPELAKALEDLRAAQAQPQTQPQGTENISLTEEEKNQIKESFKNLSATEIRAALEAEITAQGLDKSVLDALSDEELKEKFLQIIETL